MSSSGQDESESSADEAQTASVGEASASGTGTADPTAPMDSDDSTTGSDSADATTSTDSTTGATSEGSSDTGENGSTDAGETGTTGGFIPGDGLHVDIELGSNSAPGTADDPMRTIAWALEQAELLDVTELYIAEGTYVVDSDDTTTIEVVPGVSMYGGFSHDWTERDPATHVTMIIDEATEIAPSGVPNAAVHVGEDVGEDTVLDGFRIVGSDTPESTAIIVDGRPLIQHSTIRGGNAARTRAVFVRSGANVRLFEDEIVGGVHDDTNWMYGIDCSDGSMSIERSHVRSAQGQATLAIQARSCEGIIANDVIESLATGTTAYGLYLDGSDFAILNNTIVIASPTSRVYGIALVRTTASMLSIQNNNIIGLTPLASCLSGLQPDILTHNNLSCDHLNQDDPTMAELEAMSENASDNIRVDPGVVSETLEDWHLRDDGTVLCELSRGGTPLEGANLERDRDGIARTTPWSIGAYEFDGACL